MRASVFKMKETLGRTHLGNELDHRWSIAINSWNKPFREPEVDN